MPRRVRFAFQNALVRSTERFLLLGRRHELIREGVKKRLAFAAKCLFTRASVEISRLDVVGDELQDELGVRPVFNDDGRDSAARSLRPPARPGFAAMLIRYTHTTGSREIALRDRPAESVLCCDAKPKSWTFLNS